MSVLYTPPLSLLMSLVLLQTASLVVSFEISRYQPPTHRTDSLPLMRPRLRPQLPFGLPLPGQEPPVQTALVLQLILQRLQQHSTPPPTIPARPASTPPPCADCTSTPPPRQDRFRLPTVMRLDSKPPASATSDKWSSRVQNDPLCSPPSCPPDAQVPEAKSPEEEDDLYDYDFSYLTPTYDEPAQDALLDSVSSPHEAPVSNCPGEDEKHKFCLHGGRCVFMPIMEDKICICPKGYSGRRCTTYDTQSDDSVAVDYEDFYKRSHRSSRRRRTRR